MKKYLPYVYVLAAGILWGLTGFFNRHLMAGGFSVYSIVTVRNIGTFAVLGIVFLLFDRSVFRVKLRHLPYFFGTGIVSVLFFTLCYFNCQQLCSLAVAAVLLYIAPAFVVILSAILWRDKITKKKLLALIVSFLGCTFVSGVWSGKLSVTLLGMLLGIGSGLFYGLYTIFSRYALAQYRPFTVTLYTFLFASLGALFVIRPAELAARFAAPGMLWFSLALVLCSTVAPYLLYTKGLAGMDGGKASILASIEPVTAAVVGVIAFGEPLTVWVILGLLCILGSINILK